MGPDESRSSRCSTPVRSRRLRVRRCPPAALAFGAPRCGVLQSVMVVEVDVGELELVVDDGGGVVASRPSFARQSAALSAIIILSASHCDSFSFEGPFLNAAAASLQFDLLIEACLEDNTFSEIGGY